MAWEVFGHQTCLNQRINGSSTPHLSLVSAPSKAWVKNPLGKKQQICADGSKSRFLEARFLSFIGAENPPLFPSFHSGSSYLYTSSTLKSLPLRGGKLLGLSSSGCTYSSPNAVHNIGWKPTNYSSLWPKCFLSGGEGWRNLFPLKVQLKKLSSISVHSFEGRTFGCNRWFHTELQPHCHKRSQFMSVISTTKASKRAFSSDHTRLNCLARYLECGGQTAEDPWEGFSRSFPLGNQKEEKAEISPSWRLQRLRSNRSCLQKTSVRAQPTQVQPLASARPRRNLQREALNQRQIKRNCVPQFRDTPPRRDTGIASEKDWGITLSNGKTSDSGINEDGSTWYRESGVDIGENGYRCRWTVMGGQSADNSSEWKEAWWEKSDWTGYKELGAEKSGKNSAGDSWWETWQEVLRQDDWSSLARIEKTAQKQAKSGDGTAGWYEKWWEKYNAKGWTDKGAHKYGRLNDQAWWEKWGEQFDGRGAVLKWTDKWAENAIGEKWGDKWEERFEAGLGTRQGETWHVSSSGERWSRTWGEEHLGNRKVHKYGKSTSGESWDSIVDEGTFYKAEPHYGWAEAVANSTQLLSIEPLERPPGVYPDLDFGPLPPPPP